VAVVKMNEEEEYSLLYLFWFMEGKEIGMSHEVTCGSIYYNKRHVYTNIIFAYKEGEIKIVLTP
jgi:hypothetical protein